jgi:hypothetical protein
VSLTAPVFFGTFAPVAPVPAPARTPLRKKVLICCAVVLGLYVIGAASEDSEASKSAMVAP